MSYLNNIRRTFSKCPGTWGIRSYGGDLKHLDNMTSFAEKTAWGKTKHALLAGATMPLNLTAAAASIPFRGASAAWKHGGWVGKGAVVAGAGAGALGVGATIMSRTGNQVNEIPQELYDLQSANQANAELLGTVQAARAANNDPYMQQPTMVDPTSMQLAGMSDPSLMAAPANPMMQPQSEPAAASMISDAQIYGAPGQMRGPAFG